MADHIWIVREKRGLILGAGRTYYSALKDARDGGLLLSSTETSLAEAAESGEQNVTVRGTTLALEPLQVPAPVVASEPVACSEKRHIQIHKSATLTPATENATAVFFSDDWYSVGKDGYVCRIHSVDRASADSLNTLLNEEVDEHHPYRVLRVALVDESAHPSAAGVTVTEAMVEAGARAIALKYREFTQQSWESASETWREEYRTDARIAISAALTAAREVQP